ncbi:signal recognition particle-docking protein FtsY [Candidatus Dependentiae bacterium]
MFNFIKNKLKKIYTQVTSKISGLFSLKKIDEQTLKELEEILLSADTGVQTTRAIIDNLKTQFKKGEIHEGQDLKKALESQLYEILATPVPQTGNHVYVMVGINGSGKTTFAGKLAHKFKSEGKKVLMVAADTFRAAATEQLEKWAQNTGVDIVTGKQNQDPASVVFAGCEKFKQENFDVIIIDTAGRLQTKINLMRELEKIKKIITRHFPDEKINTLLTIDSMLGQNSLEQAKIFHESTNISGIVLTKMDGTGKGGIVFAITKELGIPVAYISFGEKLDMFKPFDEKDYVQELLG